MHAMNLTRGARSRASATAATTLLITVAEDAPVLELKSLMPWLQMQQVKP